MTLALVALALAAAHPPAPAPAFQVDQARLDALVQSKAPDKVLEVSALFKGAPYGFSPLGEGEGFDPDPLIRTDLFDCLTFVETTLAYSLAGSKQGVEPLLTRIRYAGDHPDYAQRNHVMEAQWVPSNLKKGLLEDITRKVAGADAVTVSKKLDDAAWSAKAAKALHLERAAQARGSFKWDIVPAAKALKYLKAAPDGTVVAVVRADRPNLVTRISHVGFLIHVGGEPYLRHASKSFGKVVDEPLASYLERNLGYAKWTVEGFSLYAVKRP